MTTLPDVNQYDDWKDYARALTSALFGISNETSAGITQQIYYITQTQSPNPVSAMPPGFQFVWMDQTTAELYLANPAYDPPDAADIVYIDTAALAAAAVKIANIADGAVNGQKISDGAITGVDLQNNIITSLHIINSAIASADIGNAAILSALIGDLQVITAKFADVSVNNLKVADAAVTSAKIANLAVGAANIQLAAIGTALVADAAITNAKIGDTIQSFTWNDTTKAGWKIDKNGLMQGRGITIYNPDGTVAFASGSGVPWASITGTTNMFTAANITTYIQGAAIGTALIANAAIGSALIADASIAAADIGALAVGTAAIQDLAVTNAKIANIAANKITITSGLSDISANPGLLRVASTGQRTELDSSQYRVYYASGQLAVAIGIGI